MNSEVIPSAHLKDVCRAGQGALCCRYIFADALGIQCAKHDPVLRAELDARVTMVARGDNCEGFPFTWYRTPHYVSGVEDIQAFRVTRFTDSSVWYVYAGAERATKRHSRDDDFWPTRQEAVAHIRTELTTKLRTYVDLAHAAKLQLEALPP